jgi:PAS domain S-box-containing protein
MSGTACLSRWTWPGAPPLHAGWYRFYFADERWEWSTQVAQIHGYEPGSVTPTTELVLSHRHPDDYAKVVATLKQVRRTHQPITTRHRIIDTKGRTHDVVVVSERLQDDAGEVVGTHGFYVDVTPSKRARQVSERAREQMVRAAVAEIADNQGPIEQAKGMLMLIYGVDAENAFELLKWRSQEANVKLRLIAEQLTAESLAVSQEEGLPPRTNYDQVLLTAHLRIAVDDGDEAVSGAAS